MMIVQYELFCFTATGKWSPRVETTVEFHLLVTELQHEHADMTEDSEVRQIAEWWWWYVREKVRIRMQIKAFLAKLCMLGRLMRAIWDPDQALLRTQMTLLFACPSVPKVSLLRDDLTGAGIIFQFAVRDGPALPDLLMGYVLRMQDGEKKFFSSDTPGFKRVCETDEKFKRMVQDYVYWHEATSGRPPSQLLGSLIQDAVNAERTDYLGGKFWGRLATRCLFADHASCLFEDKHGFLRPAITMQQVDDDQWVVITRCLKTKLLHGFQMLPFIRKDMDTVAALRHVPKPTVSMKQFMQKANVLVVVEQVNMRALSRLMPAVIDARFFDERQVLENAELQLVHDRVLAIDYLIFEMNPALVGQKYGDVQEKLLSFPQPIPMRSEDLLDNRVHQDAASQLMKDLNPDQQARLQQLLSEGAGAAAQSVHVEEVQRGSRLTAQDVQEDRAKVVKRKPEQPSLQRNFAAIEDMRVTRCVQHSSKTYYIFTRLDGQEQKLTEAGVTKARVEIKQLVRTFKEWHLMTYEMTVEDSFKVVDSDTDSGHDSDSSAEHSAGLGVSPEFEQQQDGDDDYSEGGGDLFDENENSGELVDAVVEALTQHGLLVGAAMRHPAVWERQLLHEVLLQCDSGEGVDVALLPELPSDLKAIVGQHCLIMEPHFNEEDLLVNMDEDEVCNSHFGMVTMIKGEAETSSDGELVVQCDAIYRKDVSVELKLNLLCGNMSQVRELLGSNVPSENVGIAIGDP